MKACKWRKTLESATNCTVFDLFVFNSTVIHVNDSNMNVGKGDLAFSHINTISHFTVISVDLQQNKVTIEK